MMASGPEHYKSAEAALALAETYGRGTPEEAALFAEAQAHAALARIAVLVLSEGGMMPGAEFDAWAAVCAATPIPAAGPATVWWLDDSGESPEPDFYTSYADATGAGMRQWKDANPTTTLRMYGWLEAEHSGAPDDLNIGDMELVINDEHTGIFVRPRRPKAGA